MPTVPVRASCVSGGGGGGRGRGGAGARAGRATRFLARTWISGSAVVVCEGVAAGFGAGAASCAAAVVTNISAARNR